MQIVTIPITPTLLRKYVKEKSNARISKTSIFHIRESITRFITKINKQLLVDNGKITKLSVNHIRTALNKILPQKQDVDVSVDLYFPRKPIHLYLKNVLHETCSADMTIHQDALFYYHSVIETFLSEFVQCVASQMNHAKRKTIQDIDVEYCNSLFNTS